MKENILEVGNQLISNTWLFILIGLLYILFLESKSVFDFLKKKELKLLKPVFKRSLYVLGGLALVLLAFAFVNTLLSMFIPDSLPAVDYSDLEVQGFWSTWKHYMDLTGLFGVIGFIIAGDALILSGGNRWLVTFAKLVVTLTVLFLFVSVLVAYA